MNAYEKHRKIKRKKKDDPKISGKLNTIQVPVDNHDSNYSPKVIVEKSEISSPVKIDISPTLKHLIEEHAISDGSHHEEEKVDNIDDY